MARKPAAETLRKVEVAVTEAKALAKFIANHCPIQGEPFRTSERDRSRELALRLNHICGALRAIDENWCFDSYLAASPIVQSLPNRLSDALRELAATTYLVLNQCHWVSFVDGWNGSTIPWKNGLPIIHRHRLETLKSAAAKLHECLSTNPHKGQPGRKLRWPKSMKKALRLRTQTKLSWKEIRDQCKELNEPLPALNSFKRTVGRHLPQNRDK